MVCSTLFTPGTRAVGVVSLPCRFRIALTASVGAVRDQILGPRRVGESAEEFRRRSSQASATAEELVLADHHLLTGEPESETEEPAEDDPELAAYQRDLAEANAAILRLYE